MAIIDNCRTCTRKEVYEDSKHLDKILEIICSGGPTGSRTRLETKWDAEFKEDCWVGKGRALEGQRFGKVRPDNYSFWE
jgi:hypothetical protein